MSAATSPNGGRYRLCPLCGFEFSRVDTLCQHGCPLSAACPLVRCPACGYEFSDRPTRLAAPWWRRVWRRRSPLAAVRPGEARPVGSLAPGARAVVVAVAGDRRVERERSRGCLAAFGVVPGADVELVQLRPLVVIRVGETELALEPDVAERVLVSVPGPFIRSSSAAERDAMKPGSVDEVAAPR